MQNFRYKNIHKFDIVICMIIICYIQLLYIIKWKFFNIIYR